MVAQQQHPEWFQGLGPVLVESETPWTAPGGPFRENGATARERRDRAEGEKQRTETAGERLGGSAQGRQEGGGPGRTPGRKFRVSKCTYFSFSEWMLHGPVYT